MKKNNALATIDTLILDLAPIDIDAFLAKNNHQHLDVFLRESSAEMNAMTDPCLMTFQHLRSEDEDTTYLLVDDSQTAHLTTDPKNLTKGLLTTAGIAIAVPALAYGITKGAVKLHEWNQTRKAKKAAKQAALAIPDESIAEEDIPDA